MGSNTDCQCGQASSGVDWRDANRLLDTVPVTEAERWLGLNKGQPAPGPQVGRAPEGATAGVRPPRCGNGVVEGLTIERFAQELARPEQGVTPLFDRSELGPAPSSIRQPRNKRGGPDVQAIEAYFAGVLTAGQLASALSGLGKGPAAYSSLWTWPGRGGRGFPPSSARVGCQSSHIFHPNELGEQEGIECLYLGDNPFSSSATYPELFAQVPWDFVPTRSKSEMKSALWPRWMERCAPGGSPDWSSAADCVGWVGGTEKGLFWNAGNGYKYRFLLHALVTMNGFRTYLSNRYQFPAACGMSAESMTDWFEGTRLSIYGREWVRNHAPGGSSDVTAQIRIRSGGSVQSYYDSPQPWAAYSIFGNIWTRQPTWEVDAAIADYYLWWAHRLYCYRLDGDGTPLHSLMAWWCAQLAMAQIVDFSSHLVHEWGHLTGSKWHCESSDTEDIAFWTAVGAAAGLAVAPWSSVAWIYTALAGFFIGRSADVASPQSCCQDMSEVIFQTRVSAELGLPLAPAFYSGVWEPDKARIANPGGVAYVAEDRGERGCYNAARDMAIGQVGQYLERGVGCAVDRDILSACVNGITASSTQDYDGVEW